MKTIENNIHGGDNGEEGNISTPEQKPYRYIKRLMTPAIYLVLLILALTIVFSFVNTQASFEPTYLALALNVLFVFIPSIVIAVLTIRSFKLTGTWATLLLGSGALTFGIGTVISGLLVTISINNIAATVGNLIFFLSALLHFSSGFFVFTKVPDQREASGRSKIILVVYIGIMLLIIFTSIISVMEILPPFFKNDTGVTLLRQVILGTTTTLFLLSSISFFRHYFRTKSALVYWSAFGLLLLSLSMLGILFQTTLGSPLNWIGRIAQYFSGLYLLAAALVALREARLKNITTGESLIDTDGNTGRVEKPKKRFRMIFENADTGIAIWS